MGLIEEVKKFQHAKVEKRAWNVPFRPWDTWPDGGTFASGGVAQPSKLGLVGNSVESALANTALYGGVRILASNAASLPVNTYVRQGKRNVPDTLPSIFDSSPGSSGSLNNWVFEALSSLILTGSAVGIITGRDGFSNPTGIDWVPTEHVQTEADGDQPWNVTRTKMFIYGRPVQWFGPDKEVVIVKSFPLSGHLLGLSLIKAAALTLLQGRMTQEFANNFFTQGGQAHALFRNVNLEVDPEQSNMIRRTLTNTLRTGGPLIIGADWEFTNLAVRADEAQFLESLRLNSTQVAALLGLPPEMLGGDKAGMTYSSNLQNQEAVRDALRPWLSVMESAFSDFLPVRRVVKFDDRALLRLDPAAQVNVWAAERAAGLKTLNQIHEEMDLPPVEGPLGDEVLGTDVLVSSVRGSGWLPDSLAAIGKVLPAPAPALTTDNPNDSGQAEDQGDGEAE